MIPLTIFKRVSGDLLCSCMLHFFDFSFGFPVLVCAFVLPGILTCICMYTVNTFSN